MAGGWDSENPVELAERLYAEGKLEDARALLQRALGVPGLRARAMSDLGVIAADGGDVERALRWFEDALRADPQQRAAVLNLFDSLEPLGESARAEPFLQRAAAGLSGDAEIGERLARLARRRAGAPGDVAVQERPHDTPRFERVKQRLRELIAPGDAVLDLGCGEGVSTGFIRSLGVRDLIGVDVSAERIARARSAHPGIGFLVADAVELDCGRGFDFIVLADLVASVTAGRRPALFEMLARHSHAHTLVWMSVPGVAIRELLDHAERSGFRLVSFASFGIDEPFERGEYLWARCAAYARGLGAEV
jgi:predicted TPR repeat methyltransferase